MILVMAIAVLMLRPSKLRSLLMPGGLFFSQDMSEIFAEDRISVEDLKKRLAEIHAELEKLIGYPIFNYTDDSNRPASVETSRYIRQPGREPCWTDRDVQELMMPNALPLGTMCHKEYAKLISGIQGEIRRLEEAIERKSNGKIAGEARGQLFQHRLNLYTHLSIYQPIDAAKFRSSFEQLVAEKTEVLMLLRVAEIANT